MAIHRITFVPELKVPDVQLDFWDLLVRAILESGQLAILSEGWNNITSEMDQRSGIETNLYVYPDGTATLLRTRQNQEQPEKVEAVTMLIGNGVGHKKYVIEVAKNDETPSPDNSGLVSGITFWVDGLQNIHYPNFIFSLFKHLKQNELQESVLILYLLFEGINDVSTAKKLLDRMSNAPEYLLGRKDIGEHVFYYCRSPIDSN